MRSLCWEFGSLENVSICTSSRDTTLSRHSEGLLPSLLLIPFLHCPEEHNVQFTITGVKLSADLIGSGAKKTCCSLGTFLMFSNDDTCEIALPRLQKEGVHGRRSRTMLQICAGWKGPLETPSIPPNLQVTVLPLTFAFPSLHLGMDYFGGFSLNNTSIIRYDIPLPAARNPLRLPRTFRWPCL